MTAAYRLVVWSRFRAPADRVRAAFTDADAWTRALPPGLRWRTDTPTLTAAWRGEGAARASGRVGPGLGWDVTVTAVVPGMRITMEVTTPGHARLVHRRRFERTVGEGVRVVDEIVGVPSWARPRLVVPGLRHALVAVHRRLGAGLDPDPARWAQHRSWRLGLANAAHADDALGGLDLDAVAR